jgi:phospholipid/cholesterol/gamma-HCH transport system permease protein
MAQRNATVVPFSPRILVGVLEAVGELAILLAHTLLTVFQGRISLGETIRQMAQIGVNSLPIALLTIGFSGMVLSLHTASQLHSLGGDRFVGGLVAISMAREAAPVLAAVVVAARVGSAIAAEIGSMKVTEQIDALRALAVSPVYYLVVPRFLASVLMLPVITVFANVAGVAGGYLVAVFSAGISSAVFLNSAREMLLWRDLYLGIVKTFVFGAIIALVGCNYGLRTEGGASGVGRSTTGAVVLAIVLIYVSDYFLAALMFGPTGTTR